MKKMGWGFGLAAAGMVFLASHALAQSGSSSSGTDTTPKPGSSGSSGTGSSGSDTYSTPSGGSSGSSMGGQQRFFRRQHGHEWFLRHELRQLEHRIHER